PAPSPRLYLGIRPAAAVPLRTCSGPPRSPSCRKDLIAMESKYQQLAKTLREQIAAGTFAATGLLPTEKAIAEAYQLSRQTVRQALSLLAQEGLIEKRQGSGSHIRKAPPLPESAAPR